MIFILNQKNFRKHPWLVSAASSLCLTLTLFVMVDAVIAMHALPQAFVGVDALMPCFYVALGLFFVSDSIAIRYSNSTRATILNVACTLAILACGIAGVVMAHLDSALYTKTIAYGIASNFGLLESFLAPNEAMIVAGVIIGIASMILILALTAVVQRCFKTMVQEISDVNQGVFLLQQLSSLNGAATSQNRPGDC